MYAALVVTTGVTHPSASGGQRLSLVWYCGTLGDCLALRGVLTHAATRVNRGNTKLTDRKQTWEGPQRSISSVGLSRVAESSVLVPKARAGAAHVCGASFWSEISAVKLTVGAVAPVCEKAGHQSVL